MCLCWRLDEVMALGLGQIQALPYLVSLWKIVERVPHYSWRMVTFLKQLEVVGPTPLGTHMERCGSTPAQLCMLSLSPDHRLLAGLSLLSSCSYLHRPGISGMCLLRDSQIEEKEQGRLSLLPAVECTCPCVSSMSSSILSAELCSYF